MKHEKILFDLRKDVEGSNQIKLPINTNQDIVMAAYLIDEAIASIDMLGSDSIDVPKKTIGQLKTVSSILKNLAIGNHDGPYQYDSDLFHQHLIHAINNSIVWAQNNYQ